MKESAAKNFIEAGVAPLDLDLCAVRKCLGNEEIGKLSVLSVRNMELGTLYPAQYRVVTNRNNLSVRLSTWAFRRITGLTAGIGWTSLYCPSKMLLKGTLELLFEAESKKGVADISGIAIELSSEVLYENSETVSSVMERFKNRYGTQFILSEFGDSYCPVLKLSDFCFDYVMLDSSLGTAEAISSPSAEAAVKIAKQCEAGVILCSESGEELRQLAREKNIDYYISTKQITGGNAICL